MTPIIIIGGGAGSGKDTVAEILCQGRNGVAIAQADEMKRFAQQVGGFTSEQLWGPSTMRNAEDLRFDPTLGAEINWDSMAEKINHYGPTWLNHIGHPQALPALINYWFRKLRADFKDRTLTPRAFLQTLGTEFGRAVSRDIWSNLALAQARDLLVGGVSYTREGGVQTDKSNPGHDFVVISDGRFRNEILNITAMGGITFKIENPVDEGAAVEAAGIKGHASEAELKGIPDSWYDFILVNNKRFGLEWLKTKVNGYALGMGLGEAL